MAAEPVQAQVPTGGAGPDGSGGETERGLQEALARSETEAVQQE